MNDSSQARFITFYSYKGGTGRTMAMANVGWILASAGKNVLMIDWDFEAPGLHRYLHPFLRDPDLAESDGLIDFLLRFSASAVASGDGKAPSDPNWFRSYANLAQYAYSVDYPFKTTDGKKGSLDFVPAGRQDETYSVRINGFDWDRFYTAFGGGIFLEAVKEKLRTEYDYVLIDSRTGVADTAGVCTVQMPDDLVVCFTLNRQSILGSSAVARSAFAQRNRSTKGTSLRIWPVPTRIEDAEKEKRDRVQAFAARSYADLLGHLTAEERDRYWGAVGIRYQPFYAYEEVLSTFGDRPHVTGSTLSSMEAIARYLSGGTVTELAWQSETDRKRGLDRYIPVSPDVAPAPQIAKAMAPDKPEKYVFYLSYSRLDLEGEGARFVTDLASEVRLMTGADAPHFMDTELVPGEEWAPALKKALASSSVFVCLLSPTYLKSTFCERELAEWLVTGKPILPVWWVPSDPSMIPPTIKQLQLFGSEMPESYRSVGLRALSRLKRYEEDYRVMIHLLSAAIAEKSKDQKVASLSADPVAARIGVLARKYEEIRESMPSGRARTIQMESIAHEMRDLAPTGQYLVPQLQASESPGERLAAITMLQAQPNSTYLPWLARHVDPLLEKPFISYHAAVALRGAANNLPLRELMGARELLVSATMHAKSKPDRDRDNTLDLALKELDTRLKATTEDGPML